MPPSTTEQSLAAAVRDHGAGRLAQAEAVYRQVLAEQPDHPDALNLLGVLEHQAGRSDAAKARLEQGIASAQRTGNQHAQGEMEALLEELE